MESTTWLTHSNSFSPKAPTTRPRSSRPAARRSRTAGLRTLVEATLRSLNAAGAGRSDRVAIVLDNGPEMAACFIACAAGTASAPLNPAYRADEFEFYLERLERQAADRRAVEHIAGDRRSRKSSACPSSI